MVYQGSRGFPGIPLQLLHIESQEGYGTRVIPDGAITGAHFVKTPDFVQVTGMRTTGDLFADRALTSSPTGVGNLTMINIPPGNDGGGELDPHGADGNGKLVLYLSMRIRVNFSQVILLVVSSSRARSDNSSKSTNGRTSFPTASSVSARAIPPDPMRQHGVGKLQACTPTVQLTWSFRSAHLRRVGLYVEHARKLRCRRLRVVRWR